MFKASIQISRNSITAKWRNQILEQAQIIASPGIFVWRDGKKARWVEISGFPVGTEMVLHPLWRKDGDTRYTIPIAEYNALFDSAEITVWQEREQTKEFLTNVKNLEQEIRDDCKIK